MSVEALKQALEELQYVLDSSTNEDLPLHGNSFNKTISILEQAIEQAEKQKPVAYMDDKGYICNHTTNPERWTPLYTAPPSKPMTGWQPIETAPKTGRELILLLTPSLWPQLAYSNTWWLSGFSVETNPTHWMPIPAIETKHGIFGSLPND